MPLVTEYPKHKPHGLQPDRRLPEVESGQAIVQEVFSSIQGEGPWVGVRQLFIRLAHCHLACQYCDTPMTTPSGMAYIEVSPGRDHWDTYDNPMDVQRLLQACQGLLSTAAHHSVSLTGGEPLLYPDFAASLFQQVQALGLKTYLETSGTQPLKLAPVLPYTDLIAMDIKLESATGYKTPWLRHQRFYEVATSRSSTKTVLKVIASDNTTPEELRQLAEYIPDVSASIFIQPVTSLTGEQRPTVGAVQLLSLQASLSEFYQDVRMIPQTHKWLSVT